MGQVSSATKVTGPKSKDDLKQRLKSKFERRQKEVLSEDGIVEPVAPSNHSASSVADNMAKDAEPKWERPASGGPPYRGMVMTTSIPAVSDGAPSPTSTAISDIRTPITPPPKRTASVRAAFASLARLKPPVRPRQRVKPGAVIVRPDWVVQDLSGLNSGSTALPEQREQLSRQGDSLPTSGAPQPAFSTSATINSVSERSNSFGSVSSGRPRRARALANLFLPRPDTAPPAAAVELPRYTEAAGVESHGFEAQVGRPELTPVAVPPLPAAQKGFSWRSRSPSPPTPSKAETSPSSQQPRQGPYQTPDMSPLPAPNTRAARHVADLHASEAAAAARAWATTQSRPHFNTVEESPAPVENGDQPSFDVTPPAAELAPGQLSELKPATQKNLPARAAAYAAAAAAVDELAAGSHSGATKGDLRLSETAERAYVRVRAAEIEAVLAAAEATVQKHSLQNQAMLTTTAKKSLEGSDWAALSVDIGQHKSPAGEGSDSSYDSDLESGGNRWNSQPAPEGVNLLHSTRTFGDVANVRSWRPPLPPKQSAADMQLEIAAFEKRMQNEMTAAQRRDAELAGLSNEGGTLRCFKGPLGGDLPESYYSAPCSVNGSWEDTDVKDDCMSSWRSGQVGEGSASGAVVAAYFSAPASPYAPSEFGSSDGVTTLESGSLCDGMVAVHQEQNATNIALRQPYAEEHPVSEAGPVTEENSDSESCPETEAGSDPEAGSNADGGQAEYVQPVLAAILISAVPLGLAAEDRTFSTPEEAIEAAFSREPMSASPQDQEFASAPNAFRSTGPVPVIIPGPRIDEKDTWRQLAGNADVLYMDATTAAARSEHSRAELHDIQTSSEGGTIDEASQAFLQRAAAREKLALENAARNIKRLRQQIAEMKAQDASNEMQAKDMLELSEETPIGGYSDTTVEDPLVVLWAEQRANHIRASTGLLRDLTSLITNTRSEAATALIFQSSDILRVDFNLQADEVMIAFMVLLKTISMRLNANLVGIFFHGSNVDDGLPLYTQATKFIGHRVPVVREAVRALTLNLYSIDEEEMQAFLASEYAGHYFTDLGAYITERCQALDKALAGLEAGVANAPKDVKTELDEVEANMFYLNDILATGSPDLCHSCLDRIWTSFLAPVLLHPLTARNSQPSAGKGRVRPLTALYLLERLFHVMTDGRLLNPLIAALMGSSKDGSSQRGPRPPVEETGHEDASNELLSPHIRKAMVSSPAVYRRAIFHVLHGGDSQTVGAVVSFLAAVLLNEGLHLDVLDSCGMLPPYSPPEYAQEYDDQSEEDEVEAEFARLCSSTPETSARAEDLVDAICGLLLLPSMPDAALWHVGWLLQQLLPRHPLSGHVTRLSAPQCTLVESALRLSRQGIAAEFNGMWCDAILVLIQVEWPKARAALLDPETRSATASVQSWMQASYVQALLSSRAAQRSGVPSLPDASDSVSADAAKHMVQAVQQFVAVLQIQTVLMGADGIPATPMLPPIDEAALWELELREGSVIERTDRIPCTIALGQGTARRAFFAVAGLPKPRQGRNPGGNAWDDSVVHSLPVVVVVDDLPKKAPALPRLPRMTSPILPTDPFHAGNLGNLVRSPDPASGLRQNSNWDPAWQGSRGGRDSPGGESYPRQRAVPSTPAGRGLRTSSRVRAILSEQPRSRELPGGSVLCVAPLMGAESGCDPSRPQWLHVHVRPPVRALLKVLQPSGAGDAFNNIRAQLEDGHWVLAFESETAAQQANSMVEQHAAKLRAFYCAVMVPLLVPED